MNERLTLTLNGIRFVVLGGRFPRMMEKPPTRTSEIHGELPSRPTLSIDPIDGDARMPTPLVLLVIGLGIFEVVELIRRKSIFEGLTLLWCGVCLSRRDLILILLIAGRYGHRTRLYLSRE